MARSKAVGQAGLRLHSVFGNKGVFARNRWAGDQVAFPILDQPIQAELGRAFHHRVSGLPQEIEVSPKGKMLPKMGAQPRAGKRQSLPNWGLPPPKFPTGAAWAHKSAL